MLPELGQTLRVSWRAVRWRERAWRSTHLLPRLVILCISSSGCSFASFTINLSLEMQHVAEFCELF